MQSKISTIRNSLYLIFMTISVLLSGAAQAAEDYLDYGLHWVKVTNTGIETQLKGVDANGNITINNSNYYNASKPTVIYFHGWQNGSSADGYSRENFEFEDIDQNTAKAWKDNGWNVGIFHWGQFADESEVKDAEAKMWSKNGPQGMRYRLSDGSYSTQQSPNKSVGQIAFEQITTALASNTSGNIRFAGHSLGNQLAVNIA